jgi:serine phosphatase RsbU (regulator of sigma subunit)
MTGMTGVAGMTGMTGMTGVAAVMRTGESELIAEVDQQPADPGIARATRDELAARSIPGGLQLTSVITVPLQTKRGIIGAMQFVTAGSGRRYDEDDLALAQAVAGRAADALDNLWLTERHRHTAVTLQEALLPPALPVIPGIDVAARYLPAGATAQVGGDFYDVFPLGDQTFAVFIGDVCGSGPDAAAVTSIARHTARAAARHGHCHQEVLRWVNDAVRQSDRGLFCTASFSTIELHHGTWRLRTACAGHPLPIRRMAGGGTETIGAPGTLLGVFDRITTTPAELVLDPGDVILFYTDGITDLPDPYGITPDDMLELVDRLAVHETADEIANGLHSSVNARIADAWRDDDIALIVLRVDHTAAS